MRLRAGGRVRLPGEFGKPLTISLSAAPGVRSVIRHIHKNSSRMYITRTVGDKVRIWRVK